MIRLINPLTGGYTWVADSRLDEYLAAGFKFAAPPVKPTPEEPVKRPPAKKTTTKKTTTK